jgi:hypothetical protein
VLDGPENPTVTPPTGVLDGLRDRLDSADFGGLLIDRLGWDRPPPGQEVRHEEDGTIAHLVASKRGVGVWVVDALPGPGFRRRIDVLIARRTRERLVIFNDGATQMWMWPEQRASGTGFRLVSHEYHVGSRNEALLQRLMTARFRLDEEDDITVVDVLARVRRSFNADKVTKKFYREFKEHRDELLEQIEGIEWEEEVAWYGSVLLNRLMLLYFLQKKGFLDDDPDYLRSRLRMVRDHLGDDSFYGFFKDFLLPLCHDGLGSHLQDYADEDMARIIGDVPYVNGGIFLPHVLEETYEIDVPDEAFEAVFAFFDRYRWHLDDRPSDDVNEINPDVLGYVFEQFVNSKETGAYYTKEDVTGYMTSVTVLPAFLNLLESGEPGLWDQLVVDPDRYIPETMRHGWQVELPDFVAAGLADPTRRESWQLKASEDLALPAENWWEVIDRRDHYEKLVQLLSDGGVVSAADAVSAGLDLRVLVVDHLADLSDMDAVEHAFSCLEELSVLDPTCGSGAFLFAALELLAELYSTVLERAEELTERGEPSPAFLEAAHTHPNRDYFVLRLAVLNNIFGVDLMEEAVEIARLRLFLKLAAQVKERAHLEPFPDLDLNIKAGNLLVGVASAADAARRVSRDIFGASELERLKEASARVEALYREFRTLTVASGDPVRIRLLKSGLNDRLNDLRGSVDMFLFEARSEAGDLKDWVESHHPFHWFVEFPGVFSTGGFDVVVGNPPYIKASTIDDYRWVGYEVDSCPDVYGICVERSLSLVAENGYFAMIVPHSVSFSSRFAVLRRHLERHLGEAWVSSYSRIPAGLFSADTRVRNSIIVGNRTTDSGEFVLHTTRCRRWNEEYRPHLLSLTRYATPDPILCERQWPFLGSDSLGEVLAGMVVAGRVVGERTIRGRGLDVPQAGPSGRGDDGPFALVFRTNGYNWLPVFRDPPPAFDMAGVTIRQSQMKALWFRESVMRDAAVAVLSGKWGFAWWVTFGDDFHVTVGDLESFPVSLDSVAESCDESCGSHLIALDRRLADNVVFKTNAGKRIGNFDLRECRDLTDGFDLILCDLWGEDAINELNLLYHQTIRTVGV